MSSRVLRILRKESENIQCIVSKLPPNSLMGELSNKMVDFGNSQEPALWDYADGVDTMDFLTKL